MSNPDYTFLPNYAGRSIQPVAKIYRPWRTAIGASVLGLVVALAIGFLLSVFGVALALSGALNAATGNGLVAVTVAVYAVVVFVVLLAEASYVARSGGARPFLACLAGAIAGGVAGALIGALAGGVNGVVTWLVTVAVQVVVIAVLSEPKR